VFLSGYIYGMNKPFQNKSIFNAALIVFTAIVVFQLLSSLRIEVSTFNDLDPEETMIYWENPVRLLITGEEKQAYDHPYRVFQGDSRFNLLVELSLALILILGFIKSFLGRSAKLLTFSLYANLWLYVAQFGMFIVSIFRFGFSSEHPQWWSYVLDLELLIMLLSIPLGFWILHSKKATSDSVVTEEAPQNANAGIRLFHGAIDFLLIIGGLGYFMRLPSVLIGQGHPAYHVSAAQTLWPAFLYFGTIVLVNYFSFGKILGRTPGKLITQSFTAGDANWQNNLKSSLMRVIPIEPLSILGRSMWHDAVGGGKVVYKGAKSQLGLLASFMKKSLWAVLASLIWIMCWATYVLVFEVDVDDHHMGFLIYLVYFPILFLQISFIATVSEIDRMSLQARRWNRGLLLGYLALIPFLGMFAFSTMTSSLHKYLSSIKHAKNVAKISLFKHQYSQMVTFVSLGLIAFLLTWIVEFTVSESSLDRLIIRSIGGLVGIISLLSGMFSLVKGINKYWDHIHTPLEGEEL
jgi:hypothetical protein